MRRSLVVSIAVMNTLGCLFAVTGLAIRERSASVVTAPQRITEASAVGLSAGTTTEHLVWGGLTRSYRLHVAPDARPHPALVVALHGSFGTGAGMARLTGYDDVADRQAAVVAYPDGIDRSWADGRGAAPADLQHVDDVGFLAALIGNLVHKGVDAHRVYITGMSNGAFMAQRFACRRADLVAAIAPVAGSYGSGLDCRPSRPVAVLEVHGTADPVVPYAGGPMRDRNGTDAEIESAQQATQWWARLDGCRVPTALRGPDPSVNVLRWEPCRAGTVIELWSVDGAGHTWPGGWQYLPRAVIGSTSRAFSASTVTWDFFAAHPRSSS